MIAATEQQLQLVSRKVLRLEQSVQTQIDAVKKLREERQVASELVERLRRELAAAEESATRFNAAHDEAQEQLRASASEYARTQLLQKKFQNTLLELQGYNRSIARVSNTQRGSQQFALADECTVNAVERRKSFVLDAVFDDCSNDDVVEATAAIPQFAADCLAGYNCVFFSFGPARGGKTELLYGSQAAEAVRGTAESGNGRSASGSAGGRSATNGVLPRFIRHLFSHMEQHEVTHYNIRCSFIEMHQDHVVDLLSDFGSSVMSLGSAVSGGAGSSLGSINEVSSVQVQTVQDALYLFQNGLQRTGGTAQASRRSVSQQSAGSGSGAATVGRSTPAHTAFTLLVENFNTRGHFRRSHVTFVDLCGSQSPTISSPEQLWINKSMSALCDVISMLAATREQQEQPSSAPGVSSSFFQPSSGGRSLSSGSSGGGGPVGAPRPDIPHRNNRLIQLLRDALGGNAKAAMVVSADAQVNTVDEVLTALTYAYFFKSVKQSAIPYDIPPELQRLNLQMGGIPLDD